MRGKLALKYLTNNLFCLTPNYLEMMISIAASNENIDVVENPTNTLEIDENIAIINVDGAMVKRGDFFSNICGMTSYAKIEKQIKTAEKTDGVDTILFVVDTPGGDVSGVDSLGEKIFNTKLKTVTLYEDLGASAGIWAFSGSNEVYANKTAQLGSIGVIFATYIKDEGGDNKLEILSSNAPNKRCSIKDKSCQDKIQTRINDIETIFFERVSRNTGLNKEELIHGFNQGDIVSANKALDIGFIKAIITKDELITKLKGESQMTKQEKQTLNLLANHESKDEQEALSALLATYGVNAVWDEQEPVTNIEVKAEEIMKESSKIGALLASTQSLSNTEKIECLSGDMSFEDVSKLILEKEKGEMEALDVTPPNIEEQENKALLEYAKNNKIRS